MLQLFVHPLSWAARTEVYQERPPSALTILPQQLVRLGYLLAHELFAGAVGAQRSLCEKRARMSEAGHPISM